MILNVYTLQIPENYTGNPIEYGSTFCNGTNWITINNNNILEIKLIAPGICNSTDAIFQGEEVIE